MIDALEAGRDAARRHAWAEAVETLTAADRERALAPDDLEVLGNAAWWAGQPDESTEALERAFAGYEAAGRTEQAAGAALGLAYQAFRRNMPAIGGGWQARAQRLLADLPDSPLHGWIGVFDIVDAISGGRFDEAVEIADRVIEAARKLGNTDAMYLATSFRGLTDVLAGRWREGMVLLDEAAIAASSGPIDLRAGSDIYCVAIGACRATGDLERAGQWADEGERWMRRNGAGGYPGICQVHRAELKMLHGDWAEAEKEARKACTELERFRLMDGAGMAYNAVGQIRLRMGDLDGASEAFDRAYELGDPAQPGLALLELARGNVASAQESIARALAAAKGTGRIPDQSARARLLPAQVEIALAGHDLDTARTAVDELESIAVEYERPIYRAGAMTARGELLLGEAKPIEATPILGQSWRLWQTADLPYEAAQARLHYAAALEAEGDHASAKRDLVAARAVFERLGAALDVRRIERLLADGGAATTTDRPDTRATRTFMFTDIVTSTDLIGLIGDDAWNSLLGWHDRALRTAFSEHGGEVANHTGDGFFAAFERPDQAIEAAIDIQRRLVRHRREHGFAPWVRIGLHTAEATRRGTDYSGRGVHVAARIAAAAGREEILVSSTSLTDLAPGRFRLSDPRTLTLKGVRDPVEVRSIDWR